MGRGGALFKGEKMKTIKVSDEMYDFLVDLSKKNEYAR